MNVAETFKAHPISEVVDHMRRTRTGPFAINCDFCITQDEWRSAFPVLMEPADLGLNEDGSFATVL